MRCATRAPTRTPRGRPEFREVVASFHRSRFGVTLDPDTQVMPAIGGKECVFNINFAFLDEGDVALAADPGYPPYTGGPLIAGAQPVLMPLVPELGFVPDLSAIPDSCAPARPADVRELPEDCRHRRGRLLRSRSPSSHGSTASWSCMTRRTRSSPTTATWRRAFWRLREPWTSAWRCSRSRGGT